MYNEDYSRIVLQKAPMGPGTRLEKNIVQRLKYAGCYDFSIQERWKVSFPKSKGMRTV